ncbi:MAG: hypothetical protein RLZZ142_1432, partial [Verrucomicrobiota bacterium]
EKGTGGAGRVWAATRERAGEVLEGGTRVVREHPGTSVLGAGVLGFALGMILGWFAGRDARETPCGCAQRWLRGWGHKLNLD